MRAHIRLITVIISLGLLVVAGAAGFAAKTYVVQPGDSLWAISQANGITVDQLAGANGLNPNNILPIGTQLVIPGSGGASSSSGPNGSSQTVNARSFCSSFQPSSGPWGVLPQLLQDSPGRLALQPLYEHWASHYDLSLALLEAIGWQESGWQQDVVSSTGAIGAGQIEPATGQFIANQLIGEPMNINSVSDNIRMSAAFLAYLADVEGNNRCLTIAAYYEGPLNLGQVGAYPDTQAYVASVEALIPEFE
jgi:murein DD-endopeptidase MepM/ murein hydrolase activator NlpD